MTSRVSKVLNSIINIYLYCVAHFLSIIPYYIPYYPTFTTETFPSGIKPVLTRVKLDTSGYCRGSMYGDMKG